MKRNMFICCLTAAASVVVVASSSCLPLPHPRRRGLVVVPGSAHGPSGVPRPKVVRPPRPSSGAVWVEPVWHWDGKRWVAKKNGYWVKPKNTPRGKAKGHKKHK